MSRQKRQYLVRNELQQFWTGSGWSDEYPDAWLYDSKSEASKASAKALFKAVRVFVESTERAKIGD